MCVLKGTLPGDESDFDIARSFISYLCGEATTELHARGPYSELSAIQASALRPMFLVASPLMESSLRLG